MCVTVCAPQENIQGLGHERVWKSWTFIAIHVFGGFFQTDRSNISYLPPLQHPYFPLLISYHNSNMSSPSPQTISWGQQCPWTSRIFCPFSKGPSTTAATGQVMEPWQSRAGLSSHLYLRGDNRKNILYYPYMTNRTIVFLTFLSQWLPKLWTTRSGNEK